MDSDSENVVLTPKHKTATTTLLAIERKIVRASGDDGKLHVAGGDHKGIVVNKESSEGPETTPFHTKLEFNVFLVNHQTGEHTQEMRTLWFWFKNWVPDNERAAIAQEFFKELVAPKTFPRDYVGFIKMIMKLMQRKYLSLQKLEVELRQVKKSNQPLRPLSAEESALALSEPKVLEIIESAYPNPVTIEDIAKENLWNENEVINHMEGLETKGLVKKIGHGAFTRMVSSNNNVQVVKQMPTIASSKQPTIAIITALYCEKMAVDAIIENKETFVRYTMLGESNIYTLGNIGSHRVVCTKLPTVGYTREAITAAGNTTTRLLGIFQKVEHVFMVGVGGGVPHYTDYTKHVRLGDVVVSNRKDPDQYVYTFCKSMKENEDGNTDFEVTNYRPKDSCIQDIASTLKSQLELGGDAPWSTYMKEAMAELESQGGGYDFHRPALDTDKLCMNIGEEGMIEVAHPVPQDVTDASRLEGCPRLHTGPIASGRIVGGNASLREAFCTESNALAFDFECDTVVEAIIGNCRESWALIRGIADYKDGLKKGPWQPYASLAAAGVVKAIICGMEPPAE